jgi:hypothetical protein
MLIYDIVMDNFEFICKKTICGNNIFITIQITNFGSKYLLNYSTILFLLKRFQKN